MSGAAAAYWFCLGATKVLWPAPALTTSVQGVGDWSTAIGLAECIVAMAVLTQRLRTLALSSLAAAGAIAIVYHSLAPAGSPCGCLGKLQLAHSKMVFVAAAGCMSASLALFTRPSSSLVPAEGRS